MSAEWPAVAAASSCCSSGRQTESVVRKGKDDPYKGGKGKDDPYKGKGKDDPYKGKGKD